MFFNSLTSFYNSIILSFSLAGSLSTPSLSNRV
nr:MAG TPA: hypothetical protein [Caudoviricetes sp.]